MLPTLTTPRLRLEPLVAAHAEALYPIEADPRQLEYLDHGAPASLEALRARYGRLESRRSPDGREHWLNWAIVVPAAGAAPVGIVQATVLEDRRAWVAFQVDAARWGQGIGSEATAAMIEHLARAHAVACCMATVDARNERSWRLLQRLGFRRADDAAAAAAGVEAGDWLYSRGDCG